MSLSVKGKLVKILPAETGISRSGNSWKKQGFVVETQEQFQRKICFSLFNDKVSMLNGVSEGEKVEVSFDIESREFNGKWFHNINAWKIARIMKNGADEIPPFTDNDIPPEITQEQPDDLPF